MKTLETVLESNQGLSAHILGVDGWLLRTIPEERRAVFLRLYEKAVRTALHPDLIQDANKKKFYDRYVGRVGESIAAMCADTATFEAMAEFVPAAKSRAISRDVLLAERDSTIDALRAEIKEKEATFKNESNNFSSSMAAYRNNEKRLAKSAAATHSVFTKFRSLAEDTQTYSIRNKFLKISGAFTRVGFTDNGITEKEMDTCELTKKGASATFPNVGNVLIVGATTLGGLKHCWQTNAIPNKEMEALVSFFSPNACDDRSLQLNHYITGFFKVGMILIVKHGNRNLLMNIKAVDAIDDKAKLHIIKLNNRMGSLEKDLAKERKRTLKLEKDLAKERKRKIKAVIV